MAKILVCNFNDDIKILNFNQKIQLFKNFKDE